MYELEGEFRIKVYLYDIYIYIWLKVTYVRFYTPVSRCKAVNSVKRKIHELINRTRLPVAFADTKTEQYRVTTLEMLITNRYFLKR